jgi:O-antigen/teichoic acid export membrane protein
VTTEPVLPRTEADVISSRNERSRRIKQSILAAILTRPLGFVIPILTVPLFLTYLGSPERYGLYETVGALSMWLGMANFGMSLGLVNKLTDCDLRSDRSRAQRYVSTVVLAHVGVIALALVAISTLVAVIDWASVFNLTDASARREAGTAVWVGAALALLGLLFNIPSSIYAGYQEIHRYNYWDGGAKVATLVASVALVAIPAAGTWGVAGVLVAVSGFALLVRGANFFGLLFVEKRWLRPSVRLFDANILREVLRDGFAIFVLQLSLLALFQTDKLIITSFLGASEVVPYSVLGRIFMSAYAVYAMVLAPLWPAYGDATRRGDLDWVRKNVRRTRALGVLLMVACGIMMLVAGDWIFGILSPRSHIRVTPGLTAAITCMFCIRAWAESQSIALNAAGVFRPQLIIFGGNAIVNLVLAIALVRPFGVEGVIWATSISGAVTSLWGYPWMMERFVLGAKRNPR